MKVLKFGGSSVRDAEAIEQVVSLVRQAASKDRCAVVLSAMEGTTDALIATGRTAESGDDGYIDALESIAERHFDTLAKLFAGAEPPILEFVQSAINELANLFEGVLLVAELSPKTLDRVLSFGEIISSKILSAKLTELGVENEWTDSRLLIRTDSNHGAAAVKFDETNRLVKDRFERSGVNLHILPGFIASDDASDTTTLGRGGSDYTAAIIAAALDAQLLEIWTDVSGMMTADPRFVRNVRQISHISYREAMELSHFGAKVIYPPTIQPAMAKGIPIQIKNTFAPKDDGTLIEAESDAMREIVRGITSIDKISVLSLEGSGMVGIPGFSKRLFDALSKAEINVILITQSSSEHSICVAIEEKHAKLAKKVVDREFDNEIRLARIEPLKVENGFSILALVGDRMKEHTGISGKMFTTLGHNGINIHAIAQGSSERNISAIIASKDAKKAVNTLHEEFFSDGNKQINLFVAGVGNVGAKLLDQIRTQGQHLRDELRLSLRVVGVANSRLAVVADDGLDLNLYRERLAEADKKGIDAFTDEIVERNLRNSIFVDITASPTAARYQGCRCGGRCDGGRRFR